MNTKIDIFHHDCTFEEALEVAKKYNLNPKSDEGIYFWLSVSVENTETVWFIDRKDREKWEAYWEDK